MAPLRTYSRYLLRVLAGLVAVLLLIAFISQTGMFRNWLKQVLVDQANTRLNGRLSIEALEGNLLTSISLQGLTLSTMENDTIVHLPELSLRIQPGLLLRNTVSIELLAMKRPVVFLRQRADSSWNISAVIKETGQETQDTPAPSNWTLNIANTELIDGSLVLKRLNSSGPVPDSVRNINAMLSLRYSQDGSDVELRNLSILTANPDFTIDRLGFHLTYQDSLIRIDDLLMQAGNSRLKGSVLANPGKALLALDLTASPLDLEDIHTFFPQFHAKGHYSVALTARHEQDSLHLVFTLEDEQQQLSLQGFAADLSSTSVRYGAAMHFSNVLPVKWLPEWPAADRFSGSLQLSGSGFSPDSAMSTVVISIDSCVVFGRESGAGYLTAGIGSSNVRASLSLRGGYGALNSQLAINDLRQKQAFHLQVDGRNLDMAPLLADESLKTNLTFSLDTEGTGFDPGQMTGGIAFHMAPGTALGAQIDTIFAAAAIDRGRISIDTLHVRSPLASVYIAGKVALSAENDLRFHGSLGDLRWVQQQISADTLHARGTFAGFISGTKDSLFSRISADLHDLRFDSLQVDSLHSSWQQSITTQHQHGGGFLAARGFVYGSARIDSVQVEAVQRDSVYSADFALGRTDSIAAGGGITYIAGAKPTITLSGMHLRIRSLHWRSPEQPAVIAFSDSATVIDNLRLQSSGEQSLSLSGSLAKKGRQQLAFAAHKVRLQPIAQLLGLRKEIAGTLDVAAHFSGTAQAPLLSGSFSITDGQVMEFTYKRWQGTFDYQDERLSWKFNLLGDKERELTGDGYLPIMLQAGADSLVDFQRPIRIHLITGANGGFDLSFLQTMTDQFRNISGEFSTNLLISNTLENPWPVGNIRIYNGKFDFPRYGARYRNILITLQVDTSRIDVRQFKIGGVRGDLRLNGVINYDETGIRSAELVAKAQNFVAAKNRDFEVMIDGEARLSGPLEQPRFGGTLNIKRSTFYIPAFEDNRYIELEQLQPLLAQATLDTLSEAEIHRREQQAGADEPVSDYYKNLRGELKIIIPRNTWLRGPEMNVEIAGELDIVKQSEEFDMPFGSIQVIRGTYELYGRRFKIKSGSFTFDGGEEIDPLIDIEAEYVFRDAYRNSSTMQVHITGRAYKPAVRFYLNDIEIAEVEAASYIIFGRNIEDLSQNERETLSGSSSNESNAFSLLTQLGAAQLSKTIGKRLNLDVIEFQGREESGASSILVGRYLTNNIFISVQQQLDSRQWHYLWNATATMEIEVMRNLLLQLTKGNTETTTGFDLIWKFQK